MKWGETHYRLLCKECYEKKKATPVNENEAKQKNTQYPSQSYVDTSMQSQPTQNQNAETRSSVSSNYYGSCEFCGKTNVPIIRCKLVDNMGTRYRNLCKECYEKKKATPVN